MSFVSILNPDFAKLCDLRTQLLPLNGETRLFSVELMAFSGRLLNGKNDHESGDFMLFYKKQSDSTTRSQPHLSPQNQPSV